MTIVARPSSLRRLTCASLVFLRRQGLHRDAGHPGAALAQLVAKGRLVLERGQHERPPAAVVRPLVPASRHNTQTAAPGR